MIRGRCPTCSKRFEVAAVDDSPGFPFCSERCRLVDLGRWIDGNYAIPGGATTSEVDPTSLADVEGAGALREEED